MFSSILLIDSIDCYLRQNNLTTKLNDLLDTPANLTHVLISLLISKLTYALDAASYS